jgi:3D (Asp-Asp-Asp) domain-containing protein
MKGELKSLGLTIILVLLIFAADCAVRAQYHRAVHEIEETRQLIEQLREENAALRQRMEDWLNEWDVMTAEVTAYAPLDPAAVNGMCYAGDPGTTASGAPTTPGLTVAAGPDVPYGTRIWVSGSMREVQDRGGRIGPGSLDICVATRTEALRFGRQRAVVVVERGR